MPRRRVSPAHPQAPRRTAPARPLACAALLAAASCLAHAQSDLGGKRPAAAGRVVRAFDFEEREMNPLPVPLGWIRGQEDPEVPRLRPGFPIWNGAVLDYQSPAFAGIGSVMLPVKGGSTSLMLRHGELNIFPNADYLVSARIRTDGLEHAKARVVATLLDQQGEPIEGSQSSSPLVITNGKWKQVSLEIEGLYTNAAFMRLELEVLQPRQQFEVNAIKRFTVWEQDFNGAAWFDNLVIAQLPRLDLTTGFPGNIVESQTPPELQVLVRDLTGDHIIAGLRVYDVHGREIESKTLADGNFRVQRAWAPKLPGHGWYRAILEVIVDDQLVGIRTLDFIWATPLEPLRDSGMFSINTPVTVPKIGSSAPTLIRGAGVTRANLVIWDNATTLQDLDPESLRMITIDELLDTEARLSFTLEALPAELATALAVDPDQVLAAFSAPPQVWTQWANTMLDRYGQRVAEWRFGDQPSQEPAPVLRDALKTAHDALMAYVPGPVVTIPWAVDRPLEPDLIRANNKLLIFDDSTTDSRGMQLLVDEWAAYAKDAQRTPSDRAPALGMALSPLHAASNWSGVEIWSSVGTMARKAISFWWAANASGLDPSRFELELADAWWISRGKRGQVMPVPEFIVWRTLAHHLGGRTAVEELDLIPGVRMLVASDHIADPDPEPLGALILWLEEPSLSPVTLELPLSTDTVTQIDVFGNATEIPLETVGELNLPIHRVDIGRSPIIIEGVNTQLLRFLANLRVTPDTLQAQSGVHKHALSVTNPWPIPVQGKAYIVEPGGYTGDAADIDRSWEIVPRVVPFSLAAGETRTYPIEMAYSLGELAGPKELVFDVELEADTEYTLMRVKRQIDLGLEGIELNLTARRNEAGITIVEAEVINKRESSQDFEVIAVSSTEARIRRSINALAPEEIATRQFAFSKAAPGDEIIVALMLRDSSARVNKSVTVP